MMEGVGVAGSVLEGRQLGLGVGVLCGPAAATRSQVHKWV